MGGGRRVQLAAQPAHVLHGFLKGEQRVLDVGRSLRMVGAQQVQADSRGGKQRADLVVQRPARGAKSGPRFEQFVGQTLGLACAGAPCGAGPLTRARPPGRAG